MALGVFTASTFALPVQEQEASVALVERGGPGALDAAVKLFVDAETKIILDAAVKLTADVCADVDVEVKASVDLLGGLLGVHVDVKDLEIKAKAQADLEVKAFIDAEIKALVLVNIDAHVRSVVNSICPALDDACFKSHANDIVVKVAALIDIDIKNLVVKIKADIAARVKARVDIFLKNICIQLGIAAINLSAVITIKASISVHLQACVDLLVKLLVDAKLIAAVAAL
ncbi:hypothetical protein EDD11_008552 [Mortierella claussenii]|nr:hypothetical protein EDD11_008552 [Mortierella claussenii]